MTITRTIVALTLTIAALLTLSQAAQAGDFNSFLRTAQKVHAGIKSQSGHFAPSLPISPRHSHPPVCRPKPVCPPRVVCPPRPCPPRPCPPQRCIYCVYYLDCHHHWNLYGTYDSQFDARQAEHYLEYQGYRTYTKVKHVPVYPVGPPAGFPEP